MLPAIIVATVIIYFLGFHDFGIISIPDSFYSSPDANLENVSNMTLIGFT